jgi:hypothetical protein
MSCLPGDVNVRARVGMCGYVCVSYVCFGGCVRAFVCACGCYEVELMLCLHAVSSLATCV